MHTSDIHEIFNDSLERCQKDAEFMNRFETLFFASSSEISQYFDGIDVNAVKRMIFGSLPFMIAASKAPDLLQQLGSKHHHLNIPSHLYQNWLDSMIKTVELTDPEYSEEVGEAWAFVLRDGLNVMMRAADN